MGARMCQWLHCASVQEYDTALKPIRLISGLTSYDTKQQIKQTNNRGVGRGESWKIEIPILQVMY